MQVKCTQLVESGGFEGDAWTVFEHWEAGDGGAFQQVSHTRHDGDFSMRLHASLGGYPACSVLNPWLYQTVRIPTDIHTQSRIVVQGWRAVGGSLADCSVYNSTDADDALYARLLDGAGIAVADSITITRGGVVTDTWEHFDVDLTGWGDLTSFAGQDVQVYFSATHDADVYGTWFYLDDVEAYSRPGAWDSVYWRTGVCE